MVCYNRYVKFKSKFSEIVMEIDGFQIEFRILDVSNFALYSQKASFFFHSNETQRMVLKQERFAYLKR